MASYSSTPLGLSSYSGANKTLLKQDIEKALKDAFLATFFYGKGDDGDDIAESFAKTAAGPLSDIIDAYVQNYIKSQMIQLIPKGTLTTAAGPVMGTASTLTSDIIIN